MVRKRRKPVSVLIFKLDLLGADVISRLHSQCKMQRKIRRAVGWLLELSLLVVGSALGVPSLFSQTAAEPVPAKWLRDGRLATEEFNFSIESPSPNSQWTYLSLPDIQGGKETAFIVDASTDTKFTVLVWDKSGSMNASSTKDFVEGMQKSMPKDWRVEDAKIESSAFPMKDSSKITITIHLPNGDTLYAYGYDVISGARTYMFLNYSLETTEPLLFKHFVGSFAVLRSPEVGVGFWFYVLFAGFLVAMQLLPIWISVRAKPLADKPYRWGTYVGITTAFVGLVYLLGIIRFFTVHVDSKLIVVSAIACLCAILCSIGILRRRKFGVVMFVITYLEILLLGPLFDAMSNQPADPEKQGQGLPVLLFLVITTIYFKKRWQLMTNPSSSVPPALPSPM